MTYTVIVWPYEALNENVRGMSKSTGRILGPAKDMNDARKKAMMALKKTIRHYCVIYDDSSANYVTFGPTGQRLKSSEGDEVGHVFGYDGYDKRLFLFYPNGQSKTKYKYSKYPINKDGSLGKGMW